jgi:hypothetical protein
MRTRGAIGISITEMSVVSLTSALLERLNELIVHFGRQLNAISYDRSSNGLISAVQSQFPELRV